MSRLTIERLAEGEGKNTVRMYLIQCRVKRIMLKCESSNPARLEGKIERLSDKKITQVESFLNQGEYKQAVRAIGMADQICTCQRESEKRTCAANSDQCGCCLYCAKKCEGWKQYRK